MTRETHGMARRVWLLLAQDEKPRSAAEAAQELGSMLDPLRVTFTLGATRGFYNRHPGKPVRYSVTNTCKVPSGTTKGEVLSTAGEMA